MFAATSIMWMGFALWADEATLMAEDELNFFTIVGTITLILLAYNLVNEI